MKLIDAVKSVCNDLDLELSSNRKRVQQFINRAYKELIKRERLDLPVDYELILDDDEFITHEHNDEFLILYACYLYNMAKDAKLSQLYKQEAENYKIRIAVKNLDARVNR